MNDGSLSLDPTEKQIKRLYEARSAVLKRPPAEALQRILDAEYPAALVHSFSEEDFYLLVREIGPDDAVEMLSLASNRQWEFLLDMEAWQKERFDSAALTPWLHRLVAADAPRLARWVLEEKTDFFKLYLFKNIELRVREHDEDPSAFGNTFTTFDDVLYIRSIDYPLDRPLTAEEKQFRETVLTDFLKSLAEHDYSKYHYFMLESTQLLPAESEEELYRLRNVRLAEKGFLPYHEAVGIYQAMAPDRLKKKDSKFVSKRITDLLLPVPVSFAQGLGEDDLFFRALETLKPEALLLQIQTEFAALCNRIISADRKVIQDRDTLGHVVRKACGYLSIGLERLSATNTRPAPSRAAAMLVRHFLEDVFRVGYGAAMELKFRAEKWQKAAWFSTQGLSLAFWGEDGMGVLGGLMIQRPLYFDNYETGVLYREFAAMEDIKKTERAMEGIIALDALFERLHVDVADHAHRPFFNYKNCLLTLWAGHHLGLDSGETKDPAPVPPLTLPAFKGFFSMLWEGAKKKRRIRQAMKADFLKWLCRRSGLSEDAIRVRVGQRLDALFEDLESEYREVTPENLDPRYIHLFLIQKPEDESIPP
jgi:hypothetical protein